MNGYGLLDALIFSPNNPIQAADGQIRILFFQKANGFRKKNLAFFVADITSTAFSYALMNMNIRFAPLRVSCKHKEIICAGITDAAHSPDYNFQ